MAAGDRLRRVGERLHEGALTVHGPLEPRRSAWAAFLLLTAAIAIYVMIAGRDTTFFFDEWNFLLERQGHDAAVFLDPHNGNCSLFPVVLFKSLVEVVGTDSYEVFRLVLLVLHLVVVGLVVALVRPRLGDVGALVAGSLVLVMGASADNLLWPAQFGFVLSMIGGLAALVAIDRIRDAGADAAPTRLGLIACAGLILALGSSSTGAPLWLLAAIEVVAITVLRRRWWWIVAVPLTLYLAWMLGYGDSQITDENLIAAPEFATTMAATAVGGLFGLGAEWGRTLIVASLAGLIWWWLRGGRASVRLVAALVAFVALLAATAAARAAKEDPEAPRYVYVGAVLAILVAAELLHGRDLRSARLLPLVGVSVVAVTALGVLGIHDRGGALRDHAETVKLRLAAVGLSAARVPADYRVSTEQTQITAGPVIAVQRRHGRIADTPAQLRAADADDRAQADEVLLDLGAFSLQVPSRRGPSESECSKVAAGTPFDLDRPAGTSVYVRSDAPVRVQAWRYADGPGSEPTAEVPAGPGRISLASDADTTLPWALRLISDEPLSVCAAP